VRNRPSIRIKRGCVSALLCLVDGEIVDGWAIEDSLGLMQRLGAIAARGEAAGWRN
jgi:hypothetical protein